MNHIISDSHQPDESELVVTSEKLLSGDIFGLSQSAGMGFLTWLTAGGRDESGAAARRKPSWPTPATPTWRA